MNFPRENSYLTFSGSRWIQPGLRTRKRHLHALKSLFIARAREKPGPPRFFQTVPAPLPPPPLAQWPTVFKGILNWEKKKNTGVSNVPADAPFIGEILSSVGCGEGGIFLVLWSVQVFRTIYLRLASRVQRKLDRRGE